MGAAAASVFAETPPVKSTFVANAPDDHAPTAMQQSAAPKPEVAAASDHTRKAGAELRHGPQQNFTSTAIKELVPGECRIPGVYLVWRRTISQWEARYKGALPCGSLSVTWHGRRQLTELEALCQVLDWLWLQHEKSEAKTDSDVAPSLERIMDALTQLHHEWDLRAADFAQAPPDTADSPMRAAAAPADAAAPPAKAAAPPAPADAVTPIAEAAAAAATPGHGKGSGRGRMGRAAAAKEAGRGRGRNRGRGRTSAVAGRVGGTGRGRRQDEATVARAQTVASQDDSSSSSSSSEADSKSSSSSESSEASAAARTAAAA